MTSSEVWILGVIALVGACVIAYGAAHQTAAEAGRPQPSDDDVRKAVEVAHALTAAWGRALEQRASVG